MLVFETCLHFRKGVVLNPEFLNVLIFEIEGQRHGVPAADVQELLPALAVMPVPGAPADVEGVINLRGVIVPVLNLRQRFGMAPRSVALSDHFIVLRLRDRLTALHVDHALEVARLDAGTFAEVETGHARNATARVAKVGNGMVLLHQAGDLVTAVESEKEARP